MTAVDPAVWIAAARARTGAATPPEPGGVATLGEVLARRRWDDDPARRDLPAALDALAAILELHQRVREPGLPDWWCRHCEGEPWPCGTIAGIEDALGGVS